MVLIILGCSGVIMMIGDFMELLYNQQLVIVGLATILLSSFIEGEASTALLQLALLIIFLSKI